MNEAFIGHSADAVTHIYSEDLSLEFYLLYSDVVLLSGSYIAVGRYCRCLMLLMQRTS